MQELQEGSLLQR